MPKLNDVAETLLATPYAALDQRTKKVMYHIAGRKHIARNTTSGFDEKTSRGQRAADALAHFGGSWTFIGIFAAIIAELIHSGGLPMQKEQLSSLTRPVQDT